VLTWVDRSGKETPLSIPSRSFETPRVSPDGKRLAFASSQDDRRDIWLYELESDKLTRATREGDNDAPLWTRDGRWLTYTSRDSEAQHLLRQSVDGSVPESLLTSQDRLWPAAWTADNQALLYDELVPTGVAHVSMLRLDGKRQPQGLLHGIRYARGPSFSPDGRWLAYTSGETGRGEIYVDAFPALESRQQLTVDGGRGAVWSRDGREIFYRGAEGMFSVRVDTTHGFYAGKPVRLFGGQYVQEFRDYDVAPDGRFLMMKRRGGADVTAPQHRAELGRRAEAPRAGGPMT
jgi:eukaryotic-like serine/threonine-protein kinase